MKLRSLASGVFALILLSATGVNAGASPDTGGEVAAAKIASGALWSAQVPPNWNGTLLLWSRGYAPHAGAPEPAPEKYRAMLLERGYAIAGSDYGSGGWALAEAEPAQLATLTAFRAKFGAPKRTIAWGASMGGLVTTALAEQAEPQISGALALCSSIGGAVGMMNMALDGGFVLRTLVAPDAGIELTGITDDRANAQRVGQAIRAAMQTPQGRARVALAGVLGGIPGWTRRDSAEPAVDDAEAQVTEIADAFVMGIMLPRQDQEARAGGGFSWNDGIDYRAQLVKSGRGAMIRALYAKAGVPLEADLARLVAAPRVRAAPGAVRYMMVHYTPNAHPRVPLLAVQAIGDGATSPSLQRAYAEAAAGTNLNALYVRHTGHCQFSPEEVAAALQRLERRLDSGHWPAVSAPFVAYTPPPMLRPCFTGKRCR